MANPLAERWKPVQGFEGLYEVSNHGHVRSLERTYECVRQGTRFTRRVPAKVLSGTNSGGYIRLSLTDAAGKHHRLLAHVLVATAFLKRGPNHVLVMHRDDDGSNNHTSNLKWGTVKENADDMVSKSRHSHGERHTVSVLTSSDVRKIVALDKKGIPRKDLAVKFGVTRANITMILTGRSWTHITGIVYGKG